MSGAAFQRSVLRGPVVMCQTELPSSRLVSPRLPSSPLVSSSPREPITTRQMSKSLSGVSGLSLLGCCSNMADSVDEERNSLLSTSGTFTATARRRGGEAARQRGGEAARRHLIPTVSEQSA